MITPCLTLTGRHVRLEPLDPAHGPDLTATGAEEEIWRYMPAVPPKDGAAMAAMVSAALREAERGVRQPFAIIRLDTGRAVGSTSYLDIAPEHRRIEIGWTWLGAEARRTAINTECKYLLLKHAFETLGCQRVQLKTDARNLRSQAAIKRIGAKREGVLRRHMVMPDDQVRDTVMFSIVAEEWPAVKTRLEANLARP